MISIKHIVWVVGGAVSLWLTVGCSAPYRSLDNTSSTPSSETEDKKPIKKIII